jgi:HD superfamily phosphohydrolase
VKVAGLCHDLGHGPFSHFFDAVYMPHVKPGCHWQHEQGSCNLLEFLINSNPSVAKSLQEYDLGSEEINFIKELIHGSYIPTSFPGSLPTSFPGSLPTSFPGSLL